MAQRLDGNRTYKKIKSLGEGSYGRVFLVQGTDDESFYVIKQLSLDKMDEKEINNTLTEVQVLKTFNHPNIINFKEAYKTKKGKLCIVMEYAERGDLSMAISAQNGKHFSEEQVLDWFVQICLALQYVHDSKVLHRDLKTQNIFLTKNGTVKLGDFGIACILTNTAENAKTMAGTPFNLSPEIIDGSEYSYKSDIWSLGIILYELCALVPPFVANGFTLLAMKIIKGQYTPIPSHYSKDLQNLVSMLLQTHPVQRPTVSEILSLPFIKKRVKDPLIPVKDISNLSYQREGRKPSESFVQHLDEPNLQYRSSRVHSNSRIVGIQNQSLRFLKSLYPESSKPKSLLKPESGNNHLLPSINQPSFQNDFSMLSNSKHSSFLGEEDIFVSRQDQRSPSEQRPNEALECVQEAQRNIKRNLERINNSGHLIGIDHSAVFESSKPLIKQSAFHKTRQSLEPLVKNGLKQKIVFRKVEEPEMVPISARVTPGRFKSVNRKKSYFNVNQPLNSIHEDSMMSTPVKQNPSCSPDRNQNGDNNRERQNQRQERSRKSREDGQNEGRKESEAIKPRPQNKLESIRKDVSADVLKKKERNRMSKVNSAGLELFVRSPSYFSNGRITGNDHATNASAIEEEDVPLNTKKEKRKPRKQRTDCTELDILNPHGEDKHLTVPKGETMKSLRNLERHVLSRKSPELASPIPMHAESDRKGLLNHSQFSKIERRKDSINAFDKETNGNYHIKQEGSNYLTKPKMAMEYINKSRMIVKGVLAAVNKVMADFEATDALYDKGFDLNQVKENSEINYQRKRLSNLADRRSRILNQSHLDTSLKTDLATHKDYP